MERPLTAVGIGDARTTRNLAARLTRQGNVEVLRAGGVPGGTPRRSPVRAALIGVGPHAEASWLPAIASLIKSNQLKLNIAVDIHEKEPRRRLRAFGLDAKLITVDSVDRMNQLTAATKAVLAPYIRDVDLVIVATEPKTHIEYAAWAAGFDKHVIVDKPLSTRQWSICSRAAAHGILADWERLNEVHQKHKDKMLIVNAHRRFEPAYLFALNLLREVSSETGVGLTYSSIRHSDGQWRTPQDIAEISYHGFLDGTGKIGHSGYHFLDYWACAVSAGTPPELLPDSAEIIASLHQPGSYVRQVSEAVNMRFLRGHQAYAGDFDFDSPRLGEVDAFAEISLRSQGRPTSHFQLALLHSGLSQRTESIPQSDLYRANGRVRHVYVEFQQGPFQTVVITSDQADQPNEDSSITPSDLGGRDHLDVSVWRHQVLGPPRLKVYRGTEMLGVRDDKLRLHEQVKVNVLRFAVEAIQGIRPLDDPYLLYGDVSQHQAAPELAKAIYLSHQLRTASESSMVTAHPIWPSSTPPARVVAPV